MREAKVELWVVTYDGNERTSISKDNMSIDEAMAYLQSLKDKGL
jgi:hypothetical protein